MLLTVLLATHIGLAFVLIAMILLQQGKGATAGAAFGSGASSTMFGARGSASFLTRMTSILAILFFSNSLLLAYLYGQNLEPQSLLDQIEAPPGQSVTEEFAGDMPSPLLKDQDLPAIPLPQQ